MVDRVSARVSDHQQIYSNAYCCVMSLVSECDVCMVRRGYGRGDNQLGARGAACPPGLCYRLFKSQKAYNCSKYVRKLPNEAKQHTPATLYMWRGVNFAYFWKK